MSYSQTDLTLKDKGKMKGVLAKLLNFSNKKVVIGIFLEENLKKDLKKMLEDLSVGLKTLDVVVVALTDDKIENLNDIHNVPYTMKNRELLLEACDMALTFDFNDVEELLLNGVIPLSLKRKELSDYDPKKETGNSFLYSKNNVWEVFATIVRALETFKFPYDWKHLMREGVESVKD